MIDLHCENWFYSILRAERAPTLECNLDRRDAPAAEAELFATPPFSVARDRPERRILPLTVDFSTV
jgi:hypothetical protein